MEKSICSAWDFWLFWKCWTFWQSTKESRSILSIFEFEFKIYRVHTACETKRMNWPNRLQNSSNACRPKTPKSIISRSKNFLKKIHYVAYKKWFKILCDLRKRVSKILEKKNRMWPKERVAKIFKENPRCGLTKRVRVFFNSCLKSSTCRFNKRPPKVI